MCDGYADGYLCCRCTARLYSDIGTPNHHLCWPKYNTHCGACDWEPNLSTLVQWMSLRAEKRQSAPGYPGNAMLAIRQVVPSPEMQGADTLNPLLGSQNLHFLKSSRLSVARPERGAL
jgi:hypothetical protein